MKIWDYSRVGAKLVLSFAGHSKRLGILDLSARGSRSNRALFFLPSHPSRGPAASVTCLRWGGDNLIYTGSQDTTIKVWRADDGALCRTLQGHAHWVNSLALNTDYVLRTGAFDEHGRKGVWWEEGWGGGAGQVISCSPSHVPHPKAAGDAREIALARYNKVKGDGPERLASASEVGRRVDGEEA